MPSISIKRAETYGYLDSHGVLSCFNTGRMSLSLAIIKDISSSTATQDSMEEEMMVQ